MTRADVSPRQDARFALLDQVRDLPSLPQVLVGISRVASDPEADAGDLAEVILKDQAITIKVLRIANSAQYTLCPQRITTVSRAVVLLGFESVRAIALAVGAYNLLSTLERGRKVHEHFWRESVAIAVACQGLAELVGGRVPEEAFVAGLLHDVGKLVLAAHDPEQSAGIYDSGLEGPALLAAETRAFGVNHAELAGELARRWQLPPVLERALEGHHRHFSALPEEGPDRMAFLVGVAKSLAAPRWREHLEPRELAARVARLVRRPVGRVLEMIQALPARMEEYAGFFEIQLTDLKEYALWLESEHGRLHGELDGAEGRRRRDERRDAELAAVREVHALLLGGGAQGRAVDRLLRATREAAGARRSVVALWDPGSGRVQGRWGSGDVVPAFLEDFRFGASGGGVLGAVLRTGEPVHVFDTQMPYFARLLSPEEARLFDVPCFAVLPLGHEGKALGVLYADRDRGDEPFSDDEVATLATLADLLSLALRQGAA
ncbi:MAG: HDOD domain-containing protein [Thermodesulfobacteriota bacterium]